jgi:hypothetical protein
MKKILVQNTPFKFIQNIVYSPNTDDIEINSIIVNNNLYKTFFIIQPNAVIFSAGYITSEIINFIEDFHEKTNIYIYHYLSESVNPIVTSLQNYNVKHLSHDTALNDKVVSIPAELINDALFNGEYISDAKINNIICFLDGMQSIPETLNKHLYPDGRLPIKAFNNPGLPHIQNLGTVDEPTKARLLKEHSYYLSCGAMNEYSIEAKICGCSVLSMKDLENYTEIPPDSTMINTISYSQFLMDNI